MTSEANPQEYTAVSRRILSAVEVHSIDYVPENERHAKVWQQVPFWFLGNFQPLTVSIGFIGPAMGLSLGWTIVAAAMGIVFGTLFMAFHGTQGPVLGLPQMVQSRAQLGHRGVGIALIGVVFAFIGSSVLITIIMKVGFESIMGWNAAAVGTLSLVVATVLAIYGHDWLHRVFRISLLISLPFWLIISVYILTGSAGGTATASSGGFVVAAFAVQFTVSAAYNISYAPAVSDYTRYLPRDTPVGPVMSSVFFGAAASPIWLIAIGAWLSSRLAATDPLEGLYTLGNQVFSGFGLAFVLVAVVPLVAAMGLNQYSAMLGLLTGVDSVRPVEISRRTRVVSLVVLGIVVFVFGVVLLSTVTSVVMAVLQLTAYLLVPWSAVNLIDFYFVRRGTYAITDLFLAGGVYGLWSWRGLASYMLGLASMVPFVALSFYSGPIATALNGVDIAVFVGLLVTSAAYFPLMRAADLSGEVDAVARSDRELGRKSSSHARA